jgi:hypothetical protein
MSPYWSCVASLPQVQGRFILLQNGMDGSNVAHPTMTQIAARVCGKMSKNVGQFHFTEISKHEQRFS